MAYTMDNCPVCKHHCPLGQLRCLHGAWFLEEIAKGAEPEQAREEARARKRAAKAARMAAEEAEGQKDEPPHRHGHGHRETKEWWGVEREDELFGMLGKCGHYLFRRPGHGHGQKRVLKILSKQGTMSQRELQEVLNVQAGSLSELLGKLEARGYILREKDEEDKRKAVVCLTEEGREALGEDEAARSRDAELFDVLSEEEQAQLKILLGKLLNEWYPKDGNKESKR